MNSEFFMHFVFLLFLISCNTAEHVVFSPNPTEFESRTLTNPKLQKYLESFLVADDLPSWNLDELTLAGFFFNPDLKVSQAQWNAAIAAKETANQIPNPVLNLAPQYGGPLWALSTSLDLLFLTNNKRSFQLAQADSQAEYARLQILDKAWQIRAKIRNAFLGIHQSNILKAQLDQENNILHKYKKIITEQLNSGQISNAAELEAKFLLAQNELAISDAQQKQIESSAMLAQAIGIASIQNLSINTEVFNKLPKIFQSEFAAKKETALKSRVDVLSSLATCASTHAAYELELAKQFPNYKLSPGYSWSKGVSKWTLGNSFELPIFNQNLGPMHEALAKRKVAEAQFEALQVQILNEIELRIVVYNASLEKLKAANKLVEAEQNKAKLLKSRMRQGDISKTLLLRSELALQNVKITRLDALFKTQLAFVSLEDSLQAPLITNRAPLAEEVETIPSST